MLYASLNFKNILQNILVILLNRMWSFKFDIEKAVASIKLVLKNLNGSSDFHKLFKILYFAEQKHLSKYGSPIFADRFIAMKNGPVPSNIYDLLKIIRGDSIFSNPILNFSKDFAIRDDYFVTILHNELDLEVFSESEIECLSESIEENKLLDFFTLTSKSHDSAWAHSERDDEMSVFEIAKAGGANDELVKYIAVNLENEHLSIK